MSKRADTITEANTITQANTMTQGHPGRHGVEGLGMACYKVGILFSRLDIT